MHPLPNAAIQCDVEIYYSPESCHSLPDTTVQCIVKPGTHLKVVYGCSSHGILKAGLAGHLLGTCRGPATVGHMLREWVSMLTSAKMGSFSRQAGQAGRLLT